jgi:trans-feruloyl-CoA hydratase/vanillin synthase
LIACDLAIAADEARFGLSEVNWGILPGGGATKVVADLMSMRDAMYYSLTGEMMDGPTAARLRLVNESVPLAQLEARVIELANVLLKKNPATLKAAKDAVRRVKEMTYDNAEDYLVRAQEALNFLDETNGRKEGIRQFIDEKSYKPGFDAYDRSKPPATEKPKPASAKTRAKV